MTLTDRIKAIRIRHGKSQDEFAVSVGMKRGNYAQLELGKQNPTIQTLREIVRIYNISYEWLIDDIEVNEKITPNFTPNITPNEKIGDESEEGKNGFVVSEPDVGYGRLIPLIPVGAMAGFGTGDSQVMEYESEKFLVPTFKGCDFLIAVRGSSMYPKYNSGDIVACKRLTLDAFFQWNTVYVLDTNQGALIKRVRKGKDDEHVLIISDNEKYEPFDLHRRDIHALAIVMGVIRLE